MPSSKAIQEASSKTFCQRVAIRIMRVAHNAATASPDDPAQMAYAEHVFRGDERIMVLVTHMMAADDGIATALEAGQDTVTDAAIDTALSTIWPLRVAAFGSTSMQLYKARQLMDEAVAAAETAKTAAATAEAAAAVLKPASTQA